VSDDTSQPTPLTPQERYAAALAELPDRRRRFVVEYLRDLNGTRAAIRAGYAEVSAAVQASQILSILKVREAVEAGLALQAMPAGEILARLSQHARGDLAAFLEIDEAGRLQGFTFGEGSPIHLLKKASVTERTIKDITERTVTIELYDAQAALFKLGEHYKLWGKSADLLKLIDLSKLSDDQLGRLAEGEDPIKVLLG
jgi:hypothetical protein